MRIFERAGFSCVRIEGDHYVFTKDGVARPIVIPDWREIPVFIIKNNLRSANISREEYFTLLADAN
ncbi:MAG: type II toxin-antitoxin system HicA family toxin [Pseudomonadota bacterium]